MTSSDSESERDQIQLLRQSARGFLEQACSAERRRALQHPAGVQELWPSLIGMEWTGIVIPEDFGGAGMSLRDAALIYEEMGRVLLPSPHLMSAVMVPAVLMSGGSSEQLRGILPGLASGKEVIGIALSDDGEDWSKEGIGLEAVQTGDVFKLNGAKSYVPFADVADRLLCAAQVPGEGITLFLVNRESAGLKLECMNSATTLPAFHLSFDEVIASEADMIGLPGQGWNILQAAFRVGTVLLCAYLLGAGERVYEMSIDYAHHRVQFGQQIARFQRVQDHLIEMRNHLDGMRCLIEETTVFINEDDPRVDLYVSMTKHWSSIGLYRTCEASHHLHAGIGSTKDYGLYLYGEAARLFYHFLGSPAYHERRVGELLAAQAV